jgi:poly(ADP-ribose) glycohydrolase ARH3
MDRLRSKFAGSLVGTGVGDSLGAGGKSYTDDTAMMIGVAESLIGKGRFDAEHMVQVFVRNYDAELWRGYGPGPPNIFKMIKSGLSRKATAERMYPGGSYGNGSAMRVAPIGLLYYDDSTKLKEISCQSSQITHTHPLGMEGAALQAYAVALATRTEPERLNERNFLQKLSDLAQADVYQSRLKSIEMLLGEVAGKQEVIEELGNTVEAFNSVPISIYSFLANCGFRATLDYALSLGGDRDTIAAMAGAIAGACYGIEDIPEEWKDGLENREYIEGLAERLWQMKAKGGSRQ